jgi:hypothetical protein
LFRFQVVLTNTMRTFQTIFVALAASTASAQFYSGSYGYGGYGSGLSYGSGLYGASYSAVPAVSSGFGGYSYGGHPAVSYGTASKYAIASPAISYGAGYAAPAYSYGHGYAAPAISYGAGYGAAIGYGGQATNLGVIATAPHGGPSVHEVHTGSGAKTIRLEEFQGGDQVIRVHEQPSAGPQVGQVLVPGEQSHIRVINRNGPTRVERLVHRQPTQVVELQKPGRPGARIVQVVKGESPAPSVEFVNDGGASHQVHVADDAAAGGTGFVTGGSGYALGGGYAVAAPAAITSYAAHAAPAVAVHHAAPAVAVHHAAPAVAVHHTAPAVASYAVHAAPAVATYGVHAAPVAYATHGNIGGYSTGFGSHKTVVLDSYKKKSKA